MSRNRAPSPRRTLLALAYTREHIKRFIAVRACRTRQWRCSAFAAKVAPLLRAHLAIDLTFRVLIRACHALAAAFKATYATIRASGAVGGCDAAHWAIRPWLACDALLDGSEHIPRLVHACTARAWKRCSGALHAVVASNAELAT